MASHSKDGWLYVVVQYLKFGVPTIHPLHLYASSNTADRGAPSRLSQLGETDERATLRR